MTLPGETLASGAAATCSDCNTQVKFEVCRSAAGFFVGTVCACPWQEVYSRESGYYKTRDEAQVALDNW